MDPSGGRGPAFFDPGGKGDIALKTASKLRIDDLMTGLIAALAIKGITSLSLRNNRLDKALAAILPAIEQQAKKFDLPVSLNIYLDSIHKDSPVVQDALYGAAQRNLISLDNPSFTSMRLKIGSDEAWQYLNSLPGSPELYLTLCSDVLSKYNDLATA